jgi:peptidoglycan/xylan/chitin deacetylase (PgdA/CDA1 family)
VDKSKFYKAVEEAGGKVLSYFRDYYKESAPDGRLCVPLTRAYLLQGADGFLMEIAREGLGNAVALRREMDQIAARLGELRSEKARKAEALEKFEENYHVVNHGVTHHAVKQRERKELERDLEELPKKIEELMKGLITLLWKGKLGAAYSRPTVALCDLLQGQLTGPGKWLLSLNVEGADGHVLAIEMHDGGKLTLFDPDWAFVSLPNINSLCALIKSLIEGQQNVINGNSVLAKIG